MVLRYFFRYGLLAPDCSGWIFLVSVERSYRDNLARRYSFRRTLYTEARENDHTAILTHEILKFNRSAPIIPSLQFPILHVHTRFCDRFFNFLSVSAFGI